MDTDQKQQDILINKDYDNFFKGESNHHINNRYEQANDDMNEEQNHQAPLNDNVIDKLYQQELEKQAEQIQKSAELKEQVNKYEIWQQQIDEDPVLENQPSAQIMSESSKNFIDMQKDKELYNQFQTFLKEKEDNNIV